MFDAVLESVCTRTRISSCSMSGGRTFAAREEPAAIVGIIPIIVKSPRAKRGSVLTLQVCLYWHPVSQIRRSLTSHGCRWLRG